MHSAATIYEALRYSAKKFFDNKNELDLLRDESQKICEDSKKEFQSFKSTLKAKNPTAIQQIDQFLFDSLSFDEPAKIIYEKRRSSTTDETELIKNKCKESTSDIEDIKYAIGFKSENEQRVMFKKPCVAVVGQTKAGKSTLINTLLRSVVVPQRVTRLTARMTHITYCNTKFVAYIGKNELRDLRIGEEVKKEDVDLKEEERRRVETVNIEVRLGSNNPILQNGFDIVDSPGLNENPALNDLCKQMEKSLLPLLIYVIDGRDGLTETDVEDIEKIRNDTPEIKIIYFVTKLDRTKIDRAKYKKKKEKKGCRAEDDLPGESDKEVAERRLKNVFDKLKKRGFLPATKSFENCSDFNGANLARLQELRIQGKQPCDADQYNLGLFEKFEKHLLGHLKYMIEGPLKMDIRSIQTALESVLEKATTCSSEIVSERQQKIDCLEEFRKNEQQLYESQLEKIQQALRNKISEMFDRYEASVIQIIQEEYQNVQGRVGSGYLELLPRVRHEVVDLIEKTLKTQMEDFIRSFMMETDHDLVKELEALVEKLCKGVYGRSSFEEMLRNRLYYSYDLTEEICLVGGREYTSQNMTKSGSNILSAIPQALNNLKFAHRTNYHYPQHSGNIESPEDETRRILSGLDRTEFFNNICTKVTQEFNKSHERFNEKMNEEDSFLHCNLEIGEEERKYLMKFCERLALVYMRAMIVNNNICLVFDPTKELEPIGEGSQASLKKVYLMYKSDPIVKKTYHQLFKDFLPEKENNSLGLEVYHTRCIKHPLFLKLLGIQKESVDDGFKFSTFYPYLPKGSLKEYLETNRLDLRSRLKLAIDIAKGLKHLHELRIIHRDVTPKNILVKATSSGVRAVIGDFGVLSSLGFASRSVVGTDFYYPSEVFNAEELSKIGYTFASDVYAFGITLWQLLSYNLCDDYNNFVPQFVIDCKYDKEKVRKMILEGERPERRDLIPQELNEFMAKCWNMDRKKRPRFFIPNSDDPTIFEILQNIYTSISD